MTSDFEIEDSDFEPDELTALLERIGPALFDEAPAPADTACDQLIDIDERGVWRCQRPAGHEHACFARAVIEVPDDHPVAQWLAQPDGMD